MFIPQKILRDSFDFFRDHLMPICMIVLPIVIIELLLNLTIGQKFEIVKDNQLNLPLMGVLFFIHITLYSYYLTALILYFYSVLSNAPLSPGECYKRAFNYLPAFLLTLLLAYIIIGLGLFAFIVPGLFMAVKLSLSGFFVVLENDSPLMSMKKSFDITTGYAFPIFGILVILFFPILGTQMVVYLTLQNLGILQNPLTSIIFGLVTAIINCIFPVVLFRIFCQFKQFQTDLGNLADIDDENPHDQDPPDFD